ncbi:MAG: DNA-formamidopyrimidine glycosylase family protein [Ilumatobacteraceae bacterium]
MPELPDVEHFRRLLAARLIGTALCEVGVFDESVIRNATSPQLRKAVRGRPSSAVHRPRKVAAREHRRSCSISA